MSDCEDLVEYRTRAETAEAQLAEAKARVTELEEQANGLHELFKANQRHIKEEVERAFGREMVSDAFTAVHRLANAHVDEKERATAAEAQLAEANRQAEGFKTAYEDALTGNAAILVRLTAAEAREAKLRGVIAAVEWSGFACPSCYAPEEHGHKPGCALRDALQPAAESEEKQ